MFSAPSPYQGNLWAGRTVGLLGGSFNPAHDGHRHISLYAMKQLGLDAVWWMVSPQNPMKAVKDTAPLDKRIEHARRVSNHPGIIVTDIERQLGTRYTNDTLAALQARFPATNFIWLMGNDNLHQFHLWHGWREIFARVPVCVLDRPPRGNIVKTCPAMEHFRNSLIAENAASALKYKALPAWTILHIPLHNLSSTIIRARKLPKNKKRAKVAS